MTRLCIIIGLCLLLTGCVTQEVDEQGNPIKPPALDKDLVLDEDGRIIARPTRLIPPDRMIVNGDTPTEREIRLSAVEGLPESEAPVTYKKTQEWMAEYLAKQDEIYIRPAFDSNLQNDVIYGMVYLRAVDEDGRDIPGGYVCVNQAMLSQGLVRIRDLREIRDERLREGLQKAEDLARREKRGLWSSQP
ncbi:MAG: thermonuclease family protein [Planctomycetes bacterium]|nr:thermonuclease family protein [Planctomycetota bacterium]